MFNLKINSSALHLLWILCIYNVALKLVLGQSSSNFEIKSLTGEPNYKSVNLTWEIELNDTKSTNNINTNFTVFYCEMQSWGPHKCKSKYITENEVDSNRQYSMEIGDLRMATKYSFHVKPYIKKTEQKSRGRFGDKEIQTNSIEHGQTIIIPTKGFSAHATKCLAHASEIEVETGSNFGGKIITEGENCGVQGDPKDSRSTYTMIIDHKKCGSHINYENLTVETFITVQENLGIFTHSTRRFLVICTYQPDTLTVRASFAVPGKGGASPLPSDWVVTGRNGRGRQFRMVGKNSLVLKENDPDRISDEIEIKEKEDEFQNNAEALLEEVPEEKVQKEVLQLRNARFLPLVENNYHTTKNKEINSHSMALVLSLLLSVTMSGAFVFVLQREMKRRRNSTP